MAKRSRKSRKPRKRDVRGRWSPNRQALSNYKMCLGIIESKLGVKLASITSQQSRRFIDLMKESPGFHLEELKNCFLMTLLRGTLTAQADTHA